MSVWLDHSDDSIRAISHIVHSSLVRMEKLLQESKDREAHLEALLRAQPAPNESSTSRAAIPLSSQMSQQNIQDDFSAIGGKDFFFFFSFSLKFDLKQSLL